MRPYSLAIVVVCGGWIAGCTEPLPFSGKVLYQGCAEVLAGPTCTIAQDRPLRVWVDSHGSIRWRVDGVELRGTPRHVDGGQRFVLAPPPDAKELIGLIRDDSGKTQRVRLQLGRRVRPAADLALEELIFAGKQKEANDAVQALLRDPATKAWALSSLARIDYARGDFEQTRQHILHAVELYRTAGCLSCVITDLLLLAYGHEQRNEVGAAEAALAQAEPIATDAPALHAEIVYRRGRIAQLRGDLPKALQMFEQAHAVSRRLGPSDQGLHVATASLLAAAQQQSGQFSEALALSEKVRTQMGEESHACDRAMALNSAAWIRLMAIDAGLRKPTQELSDMLREALKETREGCSMPAWEGNFRVNLAFALLELGDAAQASAQLEKAMPLTKEEPHVEVWRQFLHGELALRAGKTQKALQTFATLEDLSKLWDYPEMRWRSVDGAARAHELADQHKPALQMYAKAENALTEHARLVGIAQGADLYLGTRAPGTKRYLRLLLRLGQHERALDVARLSRSRAVAFYERVNRTAALNDEQLLRWNTLMARYRRGRAAYEKAIAALWRLPTGQQAKARREQKKAAGVLRAQMDEALAILSMPDRSQPPPVANNELMLVFHPLPAGWVLFGVTSTGIQIQTIESLPKPGQRPDNQDESLLAAFDTLLAATSRVRVIAAGEAGNIDVHAMQWRGQPLIARRPVVYGLDLPTTDRIPNAGRRGLVVVDPTGNLAAARQEAKKIGKILAARSVQVTVLQSQDATLANVLDGLGRHQLFHYAGHGSFGGNGGWQSGLHLSEGATLGVGDVLAREAVPAVVVLAACDTAVRSHGGPVEGVGVANAFALAGAQGVVAATRKVDDRTAQRISLALHGKLTAFTAWHLASALQAAQVAMAQEETGDWAAYRVIAR